VSWAANRLDIFGIGTDGAAYHKYWDGRAWGPSQTGWEYLGGGFNSALEAAAWGQNRLDIFGLGTDNGMYHKSKFFWEREEGVILMVCVWFGRKIFANVLSA
jgi:hypothetical protein